MNKLTAKYEITIPPIIKAREETLKQGPIKFTTDMGHFVIDIPSFTDGKTTQGPQWQEADTLHVNITVDIDPSVDETECSAKLDAEVRQQACRFLRLLRRKLPETAFPVSSPAELVCRVSFERGKIDPGWQLLASYGPFRVEVIPQGAGITDQRWQELEKELASGVDTELWEDFLLDSKVALKEGALIRGVLYAAIACETFIKQYTKKVATKRGVSEKFWKYLSSPEPDIRTIKYYGPILHLVTGYSLEDENKELYKSLERLFKERNKIMHEGKRSFSEDEDRRLRNDIGGVQQAISWVINLQ